MIHRISIIGSGNVATHLATAWHRQGLQIDCIISRQLSHAARLALVTGAQYADDLKDLPKESELYLICIPDDQIGGVAKHLAQFCPAEALVAHCSGTLSLEALPMDNAGVFYPLQSFSMDRPVELWDVPILITGKNPQVENQLEALASRISGNIQRISNEQRLSLHVSAVFVNNFSNYLYTIAEDICQKTGLDFDLLRPLIREGAAKVQDELPSRRQTGPAKRNDVNTIKTHLEYLKDYPFYHQLYQLLSQAIKEKYDD